MNQNAIFSFLLEGLYLCTHLVRAHPKKLSMRLIDSCIHPHLLLLEVPCLVPPECFPSYSACHFGSSAVHADVESCIPSNSTKPQFLSNFPVLGNFGQGPWPSPIGPLWANRAYFPCLGSCAWVIEAPESVFRQPLGHTAID